MRAEYLARYPIKEADLDILLDNMIVTFNDEKQVLIDKCAAVYAREFTETELSELIGFVKDPAGNPGFLFSETAKKMIRLQPAIIKETTAFGQVWGAAIGMRVEEQLRTELVKRGIKL